MGGNALKLRTNRIEKVSYEHISKSVSQTLKTAFPDATIDIIPAYEEKENFGDLDILVSNVSSEALQEFCEKVLNSPEIHVNGSVISFALETTELFKSRSYFQVDLIIVPENVHDFALKYFAFNDLGNLLGQTARGLGLKFGHTGLYYKYIVGTKLVKEICITEDFYKALWFLGYSIVTYEEGFANLEEIFEYASSSTYFSTWNYELENRNAVSRVRDKKRAIYMAFVEWFKDRSFNRYKVDSNLGLDRAIKWFPDFARDYALATAEYFIGVRAKTKFNGENVHAWTGYSGKELGEFMAAYRAEYPDSFLRRIDNLKPEEFVAELTDFDIKKFRPRG